MEIGEPRRTTVNIPVVIGSPVNIAGVWRSFHLALKRLFISDIIIRTCEGLADVFVIAICARVPESR
jgi:hypothetical protein